MRWAKARGVKTLLDTDGEALHMPWRRGPGDHADQHEAEDCWAAC